MHFVATVIAVLALAGCASNEEDVSQEPHVYIASFYPLAWATEQVTREPSAEVVNLTPPGVEPHDIELTPSDVETIDDAELVIYLGGGFQPATPSRTPSHRATGRSAVTVLTAGRIRTSGSTPFASRRWSS